MKMQDYINQLDKILKSVDAKVLNNSGSISHTKAIEKANMEYRKYQIKELSPIEKEYLKSISDIYKITNTTKE